MNSLSTTCKHLKCRVAVLILKKSGTCAIIPHITGALNKNIVSQSLT